MKESDNTEIKDNEDEQWDEASQENQNEIFYNGTQKQNGIKQIQSHADFYKYDYKDLKDNMLKSLKFNIGNGTCGVKLLKKILKENEGKNHLSGKSENEEFYLKKGQNGHSREPELNLKEEEEAQNEKEDSDIQIGTLETRRINQKKDFQNTLSMMKDDLKYLKSLLSRKRTNTPTNFENKNDFLYLFNDYDTFVLNFYSYYNVENQEQREDLIKISSDEACNNGTRAYIYLYNKMKNYVLQEQKTQKIKYKDNKKLILLTPEDIFKHPKFKPDIKNLPKFSKYFEKLGAIEMDYSANGGRNKALNVPDSIDGFKNKKRQQTLSFIERQNREALKAIEDKRLKFKNLPKANKEKMDLNNLHKQWNWIVKKEIPKAHKTFQKYKIDLDYNCKKFSTFCQKEIKKKVVKVQRAQKEYNVRAKKLQKEMMVFWRKRDKEILELRKKKDKFEQEKKKKEEEVQEAVMQKKRLEYLMKQSDIYSFFMIRNLGIAEQAGEQEKTEQKKEDEEMIETKQETLNESANNPEYAYNPKTNKVIFQSIKVNIDENAAKEDVKELINKHREKVLKFDQQMNKIRNQLGGDEAKVSELEECKMEDLALDKPQINNTSSQVIEQPKSFLGELKEYQLKGLRWLDNLYEQGINGILADEMGLGKTIQAISLLAFLSEEKNNWGPFLVVAPNATLYNWQQEINRFCPDLKVLPYWGGLKERKTLRKFFNPSHLYTKSAAFHVCITSYQLVVSDEKVFHRLNWQYMILDEAQAIKNINSQRWNTLLGFNCRNRLLLSGTPIQNSMSELWALLHFIMPNLFDSHEQFQEWFSKDIEAHSQDKGELNQEQLKRLHKILKPFMLRRIKKDVENEIGPKTEYEIPCEMTPRQKLLYNSIKQKLSNISDLFNSVDSKLKVENLMNLVMQFRKVCNHPELFERNIGKVPFIFRDLIMSSTSTFINSTPVADLRVDKNNIIYYTLPKMIYDELYFSSYHNFNGINSINIFNRNNILQSNNKKYSLFNFIHLFNFSVGEFLNLLKMDSLIAQMCLIHYLNEESVKSNYFNNMQIFSNEKSKSQINLFIKKNLNPDSEIFNSFYRKRYPEDSKIEQLEPLICPSLVYLKDNLIKIKVLKTHRFYIPKAISMPIDINCSSIRFATEYSYEINNFNTNKILYSRNFKQFDTKEIKSLHQYFSFRNSYQCAEIAAALDKGLMTELFYKYEGYSQIELPSFERLVADCAKLKKLDELLVRLKKENHRVLIFCQMTRMIDILEEYMAKRRYVYFRMDGSTNIADRRDMVNEFQVNDKIFAFLLSTRAGGLGVNLTGADTVIFYDNDWNPTMDAQATDRAHRIGQTKFVSVYRLVTKDTIEERILKRAKQKQNVQTTVYAGGAFKADIFKQSEIVELLYSEEEVQKMESERKKLQIEYNNANDDKKDQNLNLNSNNNNQDVEVNDATTSKKKSKKGKKESGKKEKGKKSKKNKEEQDVIMTETNSNVLQQPQKAIKNIFAVSTGNSKGKINALKVDSSDDENNVIIQDGDGPIEIDEDEGDDFNN